MVRPPKGYWDIVQAVEAGKRIVNRRSATAPGQSDSASSANVAGADMGSLLREALECGELRAAAVRTSDGQIITIPPASWRRRFARPEDPAREIGWDDDWKQPIRAPAKATREAFAEALVGRSIPVSMAKPRASVHWATPIIAQSDLARWLEDDDLPAEPLERPEDWPQRSEDLPTGASEEQVFWFVVGYALRAWEKGKPATREEVRDAALREIVANAREAEKAHARLPDRLKNSNRSRGSNRPK